jgi:hypothetical protein
VRGDGHGDDAEWAGGRTHGAKKHATGEQVGRYIFSRETRETYREASLLGQYSSMQAQEDGVWSDGRPPLSITVPFLRHPRMDKLYIIK